MSPATASPPARYDVVILGGGLAGLSLARQLLLESDKTVLVLERRDELPPERQKVGEATVQVSGYYFSKVLDLEEHLLREHYMKYNLRFLWKTPGRTNDAIEDYSQAYIRPFSNIASYQLDRNKLEAELLRLSLEDPRFRVETGVSRIETDVVDDEGAYREGARTEPHRVAFQDAGGERREVEADWVVDASGRVRLLAQRLKLKRNNPIRHGAAFVWVDGLVNVEKLTGESHQESLRNPNRRHLGHLPAWLATNHFCGEGFWFWVIPLQGRTSFGLVYDAETFPADQVKDGPSLIRWICEEFPLFARDLPDRELVDFAGYRSFSHDCRQTLSADRWAMTGEAGRFSDPLYSPGGDLIALYNTLIVDAVKTEDPKILARKARGYEQLMRSFYEAYVPSYALSYNALGDPEAYVLKYTWELTVYFAFYVFPFINGVYTERRFLPAFLRHFARLGPMNHAVQALLRDFTAWKRSQGLQSPAGEEPRFWDFMSLAALQRAEKTFYRVGIDIDEAKKELSQQLDSLEELARFTYAHVASVVLNQPAVLDSPAFAAGIDPAELPFDPEAFQQRWEDARKQDAGTPESEAGDGPWTFDPHLLEPLRPEVRAGAAEAVEAVA